MNLEDCRGVPVSTTSRTSLDRSETAIELMLGFSGDPLAIVDKAVAEDPSFVMGHCLRASLLLSTFDTSLYAQARASVTDAEGLNKGANGRERDHTSALAAWASGDVERAGVTYTEVLLEHPLDALALQMGNTIDYFLGDSTSMMARVKQVLPHWREAVPGYGHVQGMYAFALEESGQCALAEQVGLRALQLNARDAWAVHALAHVYETDGRQATGIQCLTKRERDWSIDNALAIHNWWHVALFYFDLGEIDQVLGLYDKRIRESGSRILMDLVDASALLWRLHLRSSDLANRPNELAEAWETVIAEQRSAFAAVHAMMAFVLAGREHAAQRLLAQLAAGGKRDDLFGTMVRLVGLPASRAIYDFMHGDYSAAVTLLEQSWPYQQRLGGSNTQRDVLMLTLIEAALRAKSTALAKDLAEKRLLMRPRSPYSKELADRALLRDTATRAR